MPARLITPICAGIVVITAEVVFTLRWTGTTGLSGQALVTARFDALRTWWHSSGPFYSADAHVKRRTVLRRS